MTLTNVLSVVGALTGITGAVFGVMSFVRDRARIVVVAEEARTPTATGYKYFVRIYVVNAGRQPIPITEVGLLDTRPPTKARLISGGIWMLFSRNFQITYSTLVHCALSGEDDPVVLNPGELRKFILIAVSPNLGADAERLWPYASDYQQRTYLGSYINGLYSRWIPGATELESVDQSELHSE